MYWAWRGNGSWSHVQSKKCTRKNLHHRLSLIQKEKKKSLAIILWITDQGQTPTCFFFFFMFVFVRWHVTSHGTCSMAHRKLRIHTRKKLFYNYLANYIWLLNCPPFYFREKNIYIENNTTYNQIHFFRSSSFGYTEVKTSAVFKFLSEKTTSDSPKVSRSS